MPRRTRENRAQFAPLAPGALTAREIGYAPRNRQTVARGQQTGGADRPLLSTG
jgi:hypothetical protein